MKRIIAVILVILCLCGCDMKRIRTESSIKEYETDFSTVYAETVKFSGMKNGEFNCLDRKSTRLNSSHVKRSRMPSSA